MKDLQRKKLIWPVIQIASTGIVLCGQSIGLNILSKHMNESIMKSYSSSMIVIINHWIPQHTTNPCRETVIINCNNLMILGKNQMRKPYFITIVDNMTLSICK